MKIKTKPSDIYREYQAGVDYNTSIGLYDTVRKNEQFYIGKQWEGLNAPDLDKPVLNFLKRVSSFIVAMLVSDDIAVQLTPFRRTDRTDRQADVLAREIERVIERTKTKALTRDMLRNCVVDGDGCFYWYFDNTLPGPQAIKGEIALELIDNTKVLFGNPFEHETQKQPYILIVKREQLAAVRERARKFGGKAADIRPDNASAIIAVQKATAAPLELQRLALYQFVEDYVRIIADLIAAHYGLREVSYIDGEGEAVNEMFDFSDVDFDVMSIEVHVGASAYWSELTQLGTLDNLFAKGVLNDALLYLENVPDGYIRNKSRIMAKLKESMEQQTAAPQGIAGAPQTASEGGTGHEVPVL